MWYWVYCFLSDFFVSDGHRYVGIARVWCLYDLFGKLNHTGLRCSDKHCLLCIGIFWSGVCAAAFSLFCAMGGGGGSTFWHLWWCSRLLASLCAASFQGGYVCTGIDRLVAQVWNPVWTARDRWYWPKRLCRAAYFIRSCFDGRHQLAVLSQVCPSGHAFYHRVALLNVTMHGGKSVVYTHGIANFFWVRS